MLGQTQQHQVSPGLQLTTPETPVNAEEADDDTGVQCALNTNLPSTGVSTPSAAPLSCIHTCPPSASLTLQEEISLGVSTGG